MLLVVLANLYPHLVLEVLVALGDQGYLEILDHLSALLVREHRAALAVLVILAFHDLPKIL